MRRAHGRYTRALLIDVFGAAGLAPRIAFERAIRTLVTVAVRRGFGLGPVLDREAPVPPRRRLRPAGRMPDRGQRSPCLPRQSVALRRGAPLPSISGFFIFSKTGFYSLNPSADDDRHQDCEPLRR